ncbi:MAG: hypothetical protein NUV51_08440 [Sulfuricaulis sp.]|nr:hypothetical protein [Sulfuricaulis sp.]
MIRPRGIAKTISSTPLMTPFQAASGEAMPSSSQGEAIVDIGGAGFLAHLLDFALDFGEALFRRRFRFHCAQLFLQHLDALQQLADDLLLVNRLGWRLFGRGCPVSA